MSSMIVHSDTEEEDDHHAVKPESEALSGLNPGPMTRTRKARDAQLRLGVGHPPAAAGRGPRTVTRSVSVAKAARSRSGRGAKPASTSIVEGWSGLFHFRLPLILSDQLYAPCTGPCLYPLSLTRHLNYSQQALPREHHYPRPTPRPLSHGQVRMAVCAQLPLRTLAQARRASGRL
jgi:hypothetical protein